jgi:hypothetical protein
MLNGMKNLHVPVCCAGCDLQRLDDILSELGERPASLEDM